MLVVTSFLSFLFFHCCHCCHHHKKFIGDATTLVSDTIIGEFEKLGNLIKINSSVFTQSSYQSIFTSLLNLKEISSYWTNSSSSKSIILKSILNIANTILETCIHQYFPVVNNSESIDFTPFLGSSLWPIFTFKTTEYEYFIDSTLISKMVHMVFNDLERSVESILTNELVILTRNCSLLGGNSTIEILHHQSNLLLHWLESITFDYHVYMAQTFGIIALKLSDSLRSNYVTSIWRILQHKIHSNIDHIKVGGLMCSTTLLVGLLSLPSLTSSSSSSITTLATNQQNSELLHMFRSHLETLKTIAFQHPADDDSQLLLKSSTIENLGILLSVKFFNHISNNQREQHLQLQSYKSIQELISIIGHSFSDILLEFYKIIKPPTLSTTQGPGYILLICKTLQALSKQVNY